jgi:predicted metalloprotease
MRWGDFRRSQNVEDRTGNAPEGAGGGMPFGGMRPAVARSSSW